MNLYRLDFLDPDGQTRPVLDFLGERLTRHYATARADAKDLGDRTGRVVRITRISGGGSLWPVLDYSGETHSFHRAFLTAEDRRRALSDDVGNHGALAAYLSAGIIP